MKWLHLLRGFRSAFAPEGAGKIDSVAFGLLILFAATAPFFYGGHSGHLRRSFGDTGGLPAGDLALEAFAFGIAGAVFLSGFHGRPLGPVGMPIGMIAAIALLGFVQLLPIPEPLLRQICPVNLTIYHETAEILRLFGRLPPAPRISIAPAETFGTVLLLLAYAALFLSSAILLRTRIRRRLFVITLLLSGVFQILVAAIREASSERVQGTFASPNNFAGYLGVLLALAFGALWAEVLTNSERAEALTDPAQRLEKRLRPLVARVLLMGVFAIGIGLTRSRGGILAASVTTLLLLTMAVLRERGPARRRTVLAAAAVLAGILIAAATLRGAAFRRFLSIDLREIRSETRFALWETSLAAWREFPVFGSGLGTFREAFRRVQPRKMQGLIEQAHSDLLQLLVTGGAVGAFLGVAAAISFGVILIRFWLRQRHREESALVLAGFGALLCLVTHGFVDYNLSIPPITATLACVLGAAWAAGRQK